MRILAIDTALSGCSASVLDSESGAYSARTTEIGRGHAEHLMPMIESVMEESASGFDALDRIAVTVGPGSFTGLRVGLSVARGFGLVLKKPVVGVTTLAAIARGTGKEPLLAGLTGRGDEIYCQLFGRDQEDSWAPGVCKLSSLAGSLPSGLWLAGSASLSISQAADISPDRIVSQRSYPDIRDVAEIGCRLDPAAALPSPLYLRPADAAPQTKGRIERR